MFTTSFEFEELPLASDGAAFATGLVDGRLIIRFDQDGDWSIFEVDLSLPRYGDHNEWHSLDRVKDAALWATIEIAVNRELADDVRDTVSECLWQNGYHEDRQRLQHGTYRTIGGHAA